VGMGDGRLPTAPAFPSLQRQFAVGLAGVQWVSLSYLLALVALLVPVGRWSDQAVPEDPDVVMTEEGM
jgi:MFS family permease